HMLGVGWQGLEQIEDQPTLGRRCVWQRARQRHLRLTAIAEEQLARSLVLEVGDQRRDDLLGVARELAQELEDPVALPLRGALERRDERPRRLAAVTNQQLARALLFEVRDQRRDDRPGVL